MRRIKTIFSFLLIANSLAAFSQKGFLYTAHLSAADSNSFYAIPLPISLLSKCQINLSDLRIKDGKGVEVPFIQKEYADSNDVSFINFPIVSKTVHADKKMHVIVKSIDLQATHLVLEIENSMASRTVNINGSNDGKQWFIIKENVMVTQPEKYGEKSYQSLISLPRTNSNYFDIVFNDKEVLPVNILKVGSLYVNKHLPPILYDTVTTAAVQQKDSGKVSYIQFSFDEPYPIDKLMLTISGSKYYLRDGILKAGNVFEQSFTINSNKSILISANAKPARFSAEIYNEDNPALKIVSVKGLIKKTTVYAYLEKDKKYSFYFGDSLAKAPVYDLQYFEKLIQNDAPVVAVGNIEKNETAVVAAATKPSTNKIIIWVAMGAVVIALLFITLKLTKEIDRKEDS